LRKTRTEDGGPKNHSPRIGDTATTKKTLVDEPRPSREVVLADRDRQDGFGEMPRESRTRSGKRQAARVWM
jgi:hypothetical protein